MFLGQAIVLLPKKGLAFMEDVELGMHCIMVMQVVSLGNGNQRVEG